jgi:solute carrier family 25 S-adenosylmethionine transporter 26
VQVRMQATNKAPSVKARVVVGQARANMSARVGAQAATLYKGVGSAAGGAGIAIGAYFAFYSAATTFLQVATPLSRPSRPPSHWR